jgi:hypothetical protein
VWSGAQIEKVAILVVRNLFAFGNRFQVAEFELTGIARAFAEAAESTTLRVCDCLLACDYNSFKRMIRLNLLFHFLFDLWEVVGRNAVWEIDVIIESVLNGWPGGELGFGPEPEDGGRHDVRARVPNALELGHATAVVKAFAIFGLLIFFGHNFRILNRGSG